MEPRIKEYNICPICGKVNGPCDCKCLNCGQTGIMLAPDHICLECHDGDNEPTSENTCEICDAPCGTSKRCIYHKE